MTRKNPTEVERLAVLTMCPRCEARPGQWCRYVTGSGEVTVIHSSRRRVVYETQAVQYAEDERYAAPQRAQIADVRSVAEGLIESHNHRDRFIAKALFGALGRPVPEPEMGPTS